MVPSYTGMRERYLDYALLFLAMAALRNRRLFLPFTLFNGLCLLNMLAIYLGDRKEKVPSTFFVWRRSDLLARLQSHQLAHNRHAVVGRNRYNQDPPVFRTQISPAIGEAKFIK